MRYQGECRSSCLLPDALDGTLRREPGQVLRYVLLQLRSAQRIFSPSLNQYRRTE